MSARRASGRMAAIAASTIALDEMWTYVGARRKEKRNGIWVWTAVVVERDGSGWIDFEAGCRGEAIFMRLLERLPDAERYEPGAYGVYGCLPVNKHVVGNCGAVNWEIGVAFDAARQVEPASASDKGLRKERGDAGESACVSLLR